MERPEVSHDGGVAQPPVTDHRAITDAVRRSGSVHYPEDVVRGDFVVWRRCVRQFARAADLRISVTRSREYVIVESVDVQSSADDRRATADVVGAVLEGRSLSSDDAPHADSGRGSCHRPARRPASREPWPALTPAWVEQRVENETTRNGVGLHLIAWNGSAEPR